MVAGLRGASQYRASANNLSLMVTVQRDSLRILYAALGAAIIIPCALFAYAAWVGKHDTQQLAETQINRTTEVLNEHGLKVFEAVERTIAEINEAIRDLPDGHIAAQELHFHERLKRLAASSSQIKSLWIFDRHGRALANSLTYPAGDTTFADRDYFKAHVERDIGTYVGTVLRPRAPFGGAPFFGISRRRAAGSGEFTGVIQASLLPEYFEGFYARLARDPGAYASLVREDGVLLARYPNLDRDAKLAPNGPLFQSMLRAPTGTVTLVSAIDGTGRTVSYRKLGEFPAFVLAGLETNAIRARWLAQLKSQLVFGLPATAALVAIIALAIGRTRRLYAEIAAREAAEEALRHSQRLEALGQLTGGVAHDFNNLLMVIGGSAERAKSFVQDARVQRSLAMIASAVNKGETLTKRLLAFSRRQTLSPVSIDLGETIEKSLEVLRQPLRDGTSLTFRPSPRPVVVNVDPDELEVALLNLTLNARDAMPDGGTIRIEIGTTEFQDCEFAEITVADTGVGIPQDVQSRIFEPYFTTKADKGTGLGLSQVYGFAQQSGGTIMVDSAPESGTTFKLLLPTSAAGEPALAAEAEAATPTPAGKEGARVLLVEDNPDVAKVALEQLEQCGCNVVSAPDAESALAMLKTGSTIDLVFSDISMPGMSGVDLGRWIRQHRRETPVLLTTGFSEHATAATREGFTLLAKPYSFKSLRDALVRSGVKCQDQAAG